MPNDLESAVHTTGRDVPLEEYHLRLGGREWGILHTGAVLSEDDEQRLLSDAPRLPYGISLWPAAIALAHDLVARAAEIRGRSILELGSGTGLPGIVAASLGARVVQTDRHELAMQICRRNAERNRVTSIEHRLADWTLWDDPTRYDWLLGADILYSDRMHEHLTPIFDANLAAAGRILLSDPFRPVSMRLLEALERAGWRIAVTKWTVGEIGTPRSVGVFELSRGDGRPEAGP